MSVDSAIARFRQRQVDVFRDECAVTRASGLPVFDPDTGTTTQPSSTVYSGPCLVRPERGNAQDVEAGAVEERVLHYVAKVPVDSDVQRGDSFTVTSSVYDPSMTSRTFKVRDSVADGWQIVRRVSLEEVAAD